MGPLDERSDPFVALPGGLGTLEEVLEALTLKQLGYQRKPITVLDLDGFFDPLWAQCQRGVLHFTSRGSMTWPS